MRAPARPHAGHGSRRQGPQAASLPPALARGPRREPSTAAFSISLRRCRPSPPHRKGRRRPIPLPHQGRRRRRAATREDAHPRRQRRVRPRQSFLRPDDDARRPREGVALEGSIPVQRKVRQVSTTSSSPMLGSPASSGAARSFPAGSSFSISTTMARAGHQLVGCERLPARRDGPGLHGQGFPHLDRHRAGGTGAPGDDRLHVRRRRRSEISSRRSRRWRTMLGNTRSVCRKCYIHPAIIDSYMDRSLAKTLSVRAGQRLAQPSSLSRTETAVLALLQRRLRKEAAVTSRRKAAA